MASKYKYRKDKKDKPWNCVLLCVKFLKACIRRVIEKYLSCKLSKRMYYYMRKHGNHFYQCFMQFYSILMHKFVVSRSFKIRFCSNLSDYRPFRLLTLQTIDPSDYWPFRLMNWHTLYIMYMCLKLGVIKHREMYLTISLIKQFCSYRVILNKNIFSLVFID